MKKIAILLLALVCLTARAQNDVEVFKGFIADTLTTAQLNALPSIVKRKGAYFFNKELGSLVTWNGSAWVPDGGDSAPILITEEDYLNLDQGDIDTKNYDIIVPKEPGSPGGGIQSVVAGTNIAVDNTDPDNPVVSAVGDMTKTEYDSDDDGTVDDSELLNGISWPIYSTSATASVIVRRTPSANIDVPADVYAPDWENDNTAAPKDAVWAAIEAISGGGATNLSYTPSATDGTVASDTGTDATIPAGSTTNASLMLPGDKTKLNGIESGADATDTANVTAAGALMDSEVDADIKTLALPGNTTISTFGASLIDDAANTNARTTLGLSDEDIQDKVGAMWTGNTESGASVNYQDSDGTTDITVNANTANIVDGAVTQAKINSDFYQAENFTPTLMDAGGGATYTISGTPTGHLTRIGRAKIIYIFMNVSSTSGAPTGILTIGGLPSIPGGNWGNGIGSAQVSGLVASGHTSSDILARHVSSWMNSGEIHILSDVDSVGVMSPLLEVSITSGQIELTIISH